MDFITYSEKIDLCSNTEIEKIKLVALYLSIYEKTNEFSLDKALSMLEQVGCRISNKSRLKSYLSKDKKFRKISKTSEWSLNPTAIRNLYESYKEKLEDTHSIDSNSELLDETKFCDKRSYLDNLIVQANNCYKNHCYDACAVLLRRIFEIALVLAYRSNNIEKEIQNNDGSTFMLEKIVANAINNETLKLSKRNIQQEYNAVRNLGNYAAHKIEYNTSIKDIDDTKTIFRVRLEELYHKANLL